MRSSEVVRFPIGLPRSALRSRRKLRSRPRLRFNMSRYSIGIDLGTTHSALSYFDLNLPQARGKEQHVLDIPQLTGVGTVESRPLLPSFLYLPNAQEFPPDSLALQWNPKCSEFVGEF